MQIERVDLASLVEYPGNPRTHPKENRAAIRASLERFGQVEPLVVWHNQVLGGNGRLAVLRDEMKIAETWIVRVDHLSESQAKALVVALNQAGEKAGWDDKALWQLLQSIDDELDVVALESMDVASLIDFNKLADTGFLDALAPAEVPGTLREVSFTARVNPDEKPTPQTHPGEAKGPVPWTCTLTVEQRAVVTKRLTEVRQALGDGATLGDALHAICAIE